jgi:toxin YoeB
MFKLDYTNDAKKQLKRIKNKKYLLKVQILIDDIIAHPYTGLGKPELLKYHLQKHWSRRIDKKNRLVYKVIEPDVIIISVIGHY